VEVDQKLTRIFQPYNQMEEAENFFVGRSNKNLTDSEEDPVSSWNKNLLDSEPVFSPRWRN
jgi:hypothetical protein